MTKMKPDLPDGQYYRFLDLPRLPAELEQLCLDQLNKPEFFLFDLGRPTPGSAVEIKLPYKGKLVSVRQCTFEVYDAPTQVKEWLLDNHIIDSKLASVGVQRSHSGNRLLPHVDQGNIYGRSKNVGSLVQEKNYNISGRKAARNYILSAAEARTCFYNSQRIDDICEAVVLPAGYWHEINTSVLHGVENIINDRISLSVTIN